MNDATPILIASAVWSVFVLGLALWCSGVGK